MLRTVTAAAALAAGALLVSVTADSGAQAQNKKWYPFKVEEHNPPFDMDGPKAEKEYTPLDKASKKWNICVSFPHMKDAYWLAVDYGVAEEAKDLGVTMHLVEAGGDKNPRKPILPISVLCSLCCPRTHACPLQLSSPQQNQHR